MKADYTIVFSDIADIPRYVKLVNSYSGQTLELALTLDDGQLLYPASAHSEELADMVDLGLAIYIADRLVNRNRHKQLVIQVVVPLRRPEILEQPRLHKFLGSVLHWFTQDHWSFEFPKRQRVGREAEKQLPLSGMPWHNNESEVSLWSGGLDSLAGLYYRLLEQPDRPFTLFGASDNSNVQSLQHTLVSKVNRSYPLINLIQLSWKAEGAEQSVRNPIARTRGFLFLLLGTVCAILAHQSVLNVYENGIGAVNLRYRASEVGIDHSRAMHPFSLLLMQELISIWLGQPFKIHNPFLFTTKAEMCESLTQSSHRHLIFETVSCDSIRRETRQRIQCGYCSSCLLRRQAVLATRIEDETPYLIKEKIKGGAVAEYDDGKFLRAMLSQVLTLQRHLESIHPWVALMSEYEDLMDVVDGLSVDGEMSEGHIQQGFIHLFRHYVDEWKIVWGELATELLFPKEMEILSSKLEHHCKG